LNTERGTEIALVEVFPRDGLQALLPEEWQRLDTSFKVKLCERLAACGVPEIEATSFAHPRRLPQLADADEVTRRLSRSLGPRARALVPNQRGLERAFDADVRKVALFLVTSETYQNKNVGMDVRTTLNVIGKMKKELDVRGIPSCAALGTVFVCPYEGRMPEPRVREIVEQLVEFGFGEICLADTAGTADPRHVNELSEELVEARWDGVELALHLHDRDGLGLLNVVAGLEAGIRRFETSLLGIGAGLVVPGDPRGMGNVSTIAVLDLFRQLDLVTGIDDTELRSTAKWTESVLFG
jgi:hydroxymethylglutaryl-CoA lyase